LGNLRLSELVWLYRFLFNQPLIGRGIDLAFIGREQSCSLWVDLPKEIAMRTSLQHAGFTLTEVMVVTLVLGLTLAASVPSFSRFMQSANLDSASKQVAGHMKLARSTAIAEGVPYLVQWSNSNWYFLIRDDSEDGNYQTGEPYTGPYWFPKGVTAQNSQGFTNVNISFLPNGTSNQQVSWELVNKKGNLITMTLLSSTGLVLIDKG
jgi:type II secretion system protein H